jgi:hypothetical protein
MAALRFAFITDTHIGCDADGWHMQPRYLGRDDGMYDGLAQWLRDRDVAFVVHGGDVVDQGTQPQIDRACQLFSRLRVPVYACLGNHDLAQADSIDRWRACDVLMPGGRDCYAVDAGAATIVLATHHWHPDHDYRWIHDGPQQPRVDARQRRAIGELMRDAARPVIAVTHAPLNDVPGSQRNDDEPYHPPHAPYLESWRSLAAEHANLKLVLAGHNHAHSDHDHGSLITTTTPAFNEPPAQVRLITITPRAIDVRTVSLAAAMGLPADLDPACAWTAGREGRNLSIPL